MLPFRTSQSGFVQALFLIVLFVGIIAGVVGVQQSKIFRSKAASNASISNKVAGENKSNVYILKVDESVDSVGGLLRPEITREFYEKYPDSYDFIGLFPAFKPKTDILGGGDGSFVQINVKGICIGEVKPNKEMWGSEKLMGIQQYPYNSYLNWQKTTDRDKILLEEISHTWLVKVGYVGDKSDIALYDPNGKPTNPHLWTNESCWENKLGLQLDGNGSHWSLGLQSPDGNAGAIRETVPWIDNGDGTYTLSQEDLLKPRKFHPFDLYVMGLIDKSEIKQDFLFLTDIQAIDGSIIEGAGSRSILPNPFTGKLKVTAKAQKVTIQDIIKNAGEERYPTAKDSQKDFTAALVILVKKGQQPPLEMVKAITDAAAALPQAWSFATDGRSTMNKKTSTPIPKATQRCIQVITSARNSQTSECKEFPTPCDIPQGWEKVSSCPLPINPMPVISIKGVPSANISGPSTGIAGQTFTFTSDIVSDSGIVGANIWISKVDGNKAKPVTSSDIKNFNESKFNCGYGKREFPYCIWYKIASGKDKTISGGVTILNPGKYQIIVDVTPQGANPTQRLCVSNPYINNYPLLTDGGYKYYNCGSNSTQTLTISLPIL